MERPAAFPIGGGNRYLSPIPTAASFPTGFVTSGVEAMCVDHISRLKATGFPSPCSIAPNAGLLFPGSGCIAGPYIRSAPRRTETSTGSAVFARTLGIRPVAGPTPVCNSRSGRKPLRTTPTLPASVRRPSCCASSSSNSAPTARWISRYAPSRSGLVSGPAIPSRSSGSITLLFIIVAYFLWLLLKSGRQQINPIRRSSSIPQNTRFGYNS